MAARMRLVALMLGWGPEQVAFGYTAGGFWPQLEFPEITRDCMIVGKLSTLLNKRKEEKDRHMLHFLMLI